MKMIRTLFVLAALFVTQIQGAAAQSSTDIDIASSLALRSLVPSIDIDLARQFQRELVPPIDIGPCDPRVCDPAEPGFEPMFTNLSGFFEQPVRWNHDKTWIQTDQLCPIYFGLGKGGGTFCPIDHQNHCIYKFSVDENGMLKIEKVCGFDNPCIFGLTCCNDLADCLPPGHEQPEGTPMIPANCVLNPSLCFMTQDEPLEIFWDAAGTFPVINEDLEHLARISLTAEKTAVLGSGRTKAFAAANVQVDALVSEVRSLERIGGDIDPRKPKIIFTDTGIMLDRPVDLGDFLSSLLTQCEAAIRTQKSTAAVGDLQACACNDDHSEMTCVNETQGTVTVERF